MRRDDYDGMTPYRWIGVVKGVIQNFLLWEGNLGLCATSKNQMTRKLTRQPEDKGEDDVDQDEPKEGLSAFPATLLRRPLVGGQRLGRRVGLS